MTCLDVRGLTSNYLDGELPEELHDRVQRHVLRCAECARETSSLRNAVIALETACPSPIPSEAFIQSTLAMLSQELNVAARPPQTPGQLVLGIGRE